MANFLWFEFVLHQSLLEKHLSEKDDPKPVDLIISFLNNASIDGSFNGSLGGSELLRLLAVKVGAFIEFDLGTLEEQLPITMQFTLFKELIKILEVASPPVTVLKAVHLLYFRWTLRSIIRLSYPTRGPRGLSIPPQMMQQLDPCYVPIEVLENMFKKLRELSPDAISYLENFLVENCNSICLPLIDCFPSSIEPNSTIKCDWTKVKSLDISNLYDIVHYELGKWYFFNENYVLADKHFRAINVSKLNDESFKNLSQYIESSKELCSDVSTRDSGSKSFEIYFDECLQNAKKGVSCDLSFVERTVDLQLISAKLNQFYARCDSNTEKQNIRRFAFYLTSRMNGLKELIPEISEPVKTLENGSDVHMASLTEGEEEGEIDGGDDEVEKDPELLLLEATVPEVIQDLIPKVNKPPLMINRAWDIPLAHASCLSNLPIPQYNKCHIALAKAAELRRAKMYIESRILYLSLLEDYQASLPNLADIITFELLETDLQHHVESNDIDERRNLELLAKCERTLRNEILLADLPLELVDLCCLFLLESSPQTLKDFVNSKHPLLRLSSLLSSLASTDSPSHHPMKAKELWDLICNVLPYDRNRIIAKRNIHLPLSSWDLDIFCQFIKKLKNSAHINLLTSCLIKILNLKRDISGIELTVLPQPTFQWPSSLPASSANIDLSSIFDTLKVLLKKGLSLKPNEINLLRCKAELAIIEGQYADAMSNYLTLMIITTEYFTVFGTYPEEEKIISRMIHCSTKLGCHTQAAVLHQMVKEPNYALIFKGLSEKSCNDSCDDLYDSFWDITILEYLVNLHTRRGEIDRKNKSLHLIGQSELNANNPEDILNEAANVRKGKFFRTMAKKYL
ncbi:integrator complex subunit 8-like [Tetranychus urticae]|uniref:INTS8 TPR repeats domain-containing protein n=1 Tax=Tetranychus urticae TaxID=32264 RepID=T1KFK4_TETUR|nr:integrator complex subunit 8-like [Tetranychus urticae]